MVEQTMELFDVGFELRGVTRLVAMAVVLLLSTAGTVGIVGPARPASAAPGDLTYFPDEDFRENVFNIALGPDGNVWYSYLAGSGPGTTSHIARVTPSGTYTYVDLPTGSVPSMVAGPDGFLWITQGSSLYRLNTTTLALSAPIPLSLGGAFGIIVGPDGNLWWSGTDVIGRTTPAGVTTTYTDGADRLDFVGGMTVGADGDIWFVNTTEDTIGHLDPLAADPAATIDMVSAPQLRALEGIAAGPDGNVWVTSSSPNPGIGDLTRVTPAEVTTDVNNPAIFGGRDIALGPDGNLWYATMGEGLGVIDPVSLQMTAFSAPHPHHNDYQATDLVGGPNDDHVWFVSVRRGGFSGSETPGGVSSIEADPFDGVEPDPCATPAFSDVALTHPFYDDICWMADEGVSTGYPGSPKPSYKPSAAVTRQAMSAFMQRLGDFTVPPPPSPTFTDVGDTHPFYDEIEWMAGTGVSTGYQPGPTYKPSAPVTRQAMSAFMHRLAGDAPVTLPPSPSFDDVGSSHPFYDDIEWMAAEEISTGYTDGTYRPDDAVTRQAMSAFMHRLADGPGVGITP
jgi:streptogramin lyase